MAKKPKKYAKLLSRHQPPGGLIPMIKCVYFRPYLCVAGTLWIKHNRQLPIVLKELFYFNLHWIWMVI